MQFELIAKLGLQEVAHVTGRVGDNNISIADLHNVIPVEQFLERLFGLRFHLQEVPAKKAATKKAT